MIKDSLATFFIFIFYSLLLFSSSLEAHGFKALRLYVETSSGPWWKIRIHYHNPETGRYQEMYYLTRSRKNFEFIYQYLMEGGEFFQGPIEKSLHRHIGTQIIPVQLPEN